MVLEYTITENQLDFLIKFNQRNSPATVKSMRGGWFQIMVFFVAFFLIWIILSWFFWDGTGSNPLWKIGDLFLLAILYIALFPLFKKFNNYIFLKQFKKHDVYDGLTGERRLLTGEDSLRLETEISIFELRYTAINKIILTDQSLLLWRNLNVCIIVSLPAFPSLDQRNEFLNLLREKTQAAFLHVGKNFVEHPFDPGAGQAIEGASARS